MKPAIKIKRIYEPFAETDGFRILVDRVWPRGVSKAQAHLDIWAKEIAPTSLLRKWFNHDAKRWETFKLKYKAELDSNEAVNVITRDCTKHKIVTLLYSAKDEKHNQALVLQEYFTEQLKS